VIFNPEQVKPSALAGSVARAHRSASLIVLAIGFSVGIYTAIGLLLFGTSKQSAPAANYQIQFLFAAGLLAFASIAYRRAQFGRGRLEVVATLRGVEGLIKHFAQTTIIAVAIAEIIGLLALVIVFFGGTQRDVLILGLVGMFVVFTNYPRRDAWLRTVQYFDANLYDNESETKRV
jgi:hypothetical protein